MDHPAIRISGLRKTYGDLAAVDGVSFEVRPGEIFGLVGPNGAGKTTTIECLEGLRRADGGDIQVLGLDPRRDGPALRQKIGAQLQESALPQRIRVGEALDLFSSFYAHPVPWEPLLDQLGLAEKRRAAFGKLSGGQKQRLFIALALVNDPVLVFFDELSTGLDPQARRSMWDFIGNVRAAGKTVFLTTHYMEEAERLCDRVAVMDHGRLAALDTPEALIRGLGAENRVVFATDSPLDPGMFRSLPGVTRVEPVGERTIVYGRDDRLVVEVVNALSLNRIKFRDLRTEQANLEDVFLALTGREMRD
ncbi:MAG: ABC transporter ATP-binding protein [Candidatus Aminicenantales bacterium]|jgi:ABC-2 type transport system ATP-binding protein